jgi:hypothetical protein
MAQSAKGVLESGSAGCFRVFYVLLWGSAPQGDAPILPALRTPLKTPANLLAHAHLTVREGANSGVGGVGF